MGITEAFYFLKSKVEDGIDFVKDKVEDLKRNIEYKLDDLKWKFSKKEYVSTSLEDQIDVDKELDNFRESIQDDVNDLEKLCMDEMGRKFEDIRNEVRKKFPDLVELLDKEQMMATEKLSGAIMQYVKEHLSKNDDRFRQVLEMKPGKEKREALNIETERVLGGAEKNFNKKLIKHIKNIQTELTTRLEIRMTDEEKQMNKKLIEITELEKKAKSGSVDVDAVTDERVPIIETAQCIIATLEMER